MDEMNITSAQYVRNKDTNQIHQIKITLDGQEMFVPLSEDNRHYAEIMRQSEAGTLTIAEADTP